VTVVVGPSQPVSAAIGVPRLAAPRECWRPPHHGPTTARYTNTRSTPHTVAVKIKLARIGKVHSPFYRVVVADARKTPKSRVIEFIGQYRPKVEPSVIDINSERVQYWLGVGAQPTESVLALLK